MTTHSPAAIAGYIAAMMGAFAPASAAGRRLAEWLRTYQHAVGIDFDAAAVPRTPSGRRRRLPAADRPLSAPSWNRLREAVAAAAGAATHDDTMSRNVDAFAEAIGLDELEAALFRFVFHTDRDKSFGDLCSGLVSTRSIDGLGLIALALARRPSDLWARLVRGPLRELNLIEVPDDSVGKFTYFVPYRVLQALLPPNDGLADIERRLIGPPLRPSIGSDAFAHVARERDFVLRLLRGAIAAGRPGVNVLIYGAPGTGKSEFCKMAAHHIGCSLFAVGEADEDGNEPSRHERIDALRIAEKLAARRGNAALLFDEMEDIQERGESAASGRRRVRRAGSKVFFNRVLERNSVPVLWTSNSIDEFDPAFLRRMTFMFEMKTPPMQARSRLWHDLARREGLHLPEPEAAALARRHRVAPSIMSGAAQAVAIARGSADEIDFVVEALARPVHGGTRGKPAGPAADFVPALANADIDIVALERALTRAGASRNVAICIYGPPGTGKSAFLRHLAEAMGLEPLHKRGSDLLSKWIGETEQRIAEAFEEARQEERFLIFDEAESFLWSRGGAERSWEVSQVNELLTAMETHPLPFGCTTNHADFVDPAARRRFTFAIKFDFLTSGQAEIAYRRFFGRKPQPALRELVTLTPADFAAVARKLRLLDAAAPSDGVIFEMLEAEARSKNASSRKIGF